MKELHYNSGLASALRGLIPAGTIVCVFCMNDYMGMRKVETVMDNWKKVSVQTIKNGQTPPPSPATVQILTTDPSSSSITFDSAKFKVTEGQK